jgi:hypothetical protein
MQRFLKQSNAKSSIRYLFRVPKYPVLCCIEEQVIGATSERILVEKLSLIMFQEGKYYDVIDVTGESWTLMSDVMVISPLTAKKRWTKLQLIRLVNSRTNTSNPHEKPYSERSLSSKRFKKIFLDLVDMTC